MIHFWRAQIKLWSQPTFQPVYRCYLPTYHATWLFQSSPDPIPESLDPPNLSGVPTQYHDLKANFRKQMAFTLPPHHPYNCAIDLLPGSCHPRVRIFSLSNLEQAAMGDHIKEALGAGFVPPSTSPTGAAIFFLGKKDGSLCPCNDYWSLNKIRVWKHYPLLLLFTTFKLLQRASIFTKLDLHNAYHLVHIRQGDEWKTTLTPTLNTKSCGIPILCHHQE